MYYFSLLPSELNEIVIFNLSLNDLENFFNIIPYEELLNWSRISSYRYEETLNKDLCLTYLPIEVLKQKLSYSILGKMKIKSIYELIELDLSKKNKRNTKRNRKFNQFTNIIFI